MYNLPLSRKCMYIMLKHILHDYHSYSLVQAHSTIKQRSPRKRFSTFSIRFKNRVWTAVLRETPIGKSRHAILARKPKREHRLEQTFLQPQTLLRLHCSSRRLPQIKLALLCTNRKATLTSCGWLMYVKEGFETVQFEKGKPSSVNKSYMCGKKKINQAGQQ